MKHILKFTVLIIIIFSNRMNAQLDTLNYLKTFEANKTLYIGKPLSFLLNNMAQIQPKTIWSLPNFKTKNLNFSSEFKFVNKENSFKKNNIFLYIVWDEPIPMSQVEYYEKKNHFNFTDEERSFYGNKIIKNIQVYR